MLSIKNTGEKVLSSRVIDGSSYDILTNLRVSYLDYNDKVVYNFEKELREPVQKGPPKWQPVDFPLPKIMS